MLVARGDLGVGETGGFELVGPGCRFAGLATVAHRNYRAMGLRFLSWQGLAYRPVCALIGARLPRRLVSGGAGRRDPHPLRRLVVFTGIERPGEPALAARRPRSRSGDRAARASRATLPVTIWPRWPSGTGESR